MDLSGKVALVTGSSSGIGEACARRLSGEGARVVVNSRSSVEAGEAVAAELADAAYVQADVADPGQCSALVDAAVERFGRLDVLVNNAGTTRFIPHHDLDAVTPEVWLEILGTNVLGTWELTRLSMPHLAADGGGAVVNVTSLAGIRPTGSSIPYGVSKAAINHMTVMLANVCGPEVRVNGVAPGLVETPWTRTGYPDEVFELVRQRTPLGRWAQPDDVAELVVSVATADFVTGQVVLADGGQGLRV